VAEDFFGSYTFDRGIGYSVIDVWEGPKIFRAVVTNETDEGFLRREIRDRDPQKLFFREMAIIRSVPGTKLVLMVEEGEPFPWRVRTEDDEVHEFVEGFMRTPAGREIRKNILFGLEHQVDTENGNGFGRRSKK